MMCNCFGCGEFEACSKIDISRISKHHFKYYCSDCTIDLFIQLELD